MSPLLFGGRQEEVRLCIQGSSLRHAAIAGRGPAGTSVSTRPPATASRRRPSRGPTAPGTRPAVRSSANRVGHHREGDLGKVRVFHPRRLPQRGQQRAGVVPAPGPARPRCTRPACPGSAGPRTARRSGPSGTRPARRRRRSPGASPPPRTRGRPRRRSGSDRRETGASVGGRGRAGTDRIRPRAVRHPPPVPVRRGRLAAPVKRMTTPPIPPRTTPPPRQTGPAAHRQRNRGGRSAGSAGAIASPSRRRLTHSLARRPGRDNEEGVRAAAQPVGDVALAGVVAALQRQHDQPVAGAGRHVRGGPLAAGRQLVGKPARRGPPSPARRAARPYPSRRARVSCSWDTSRSGSSCIRTSRTFS